MFLRNLNINQGAHNKAVRSGQPHELIIDQLTQYQDTIKKPTVMWPHRYNDDKQPNIAEDLACDFNFIITQKMNLDKADYYKTMGESQVIFSCALHENLGISVMEAVLAGAIPIVPDRASYREMYLAEFKYPSEWTQDFDSFIKHRSQLVEFIQERLDNADAYASLLQDQRDILIRDYLNSSVMINNIIRKGT